MLCPGHQQVPSPAEGEVEELGTETSKILASGRILMGKRLAYSNFHEQTDFDGHKSMNTQGGFASKTI